MMSNDMLFNLIRTSLNKDCTIDDEVLKDVDWNEVINIASAHGISAIAFDGLEKIIEARQDTKSIGFGAEVSEKEDRNVGEVLKEVMPEDFIKFGLIPEFIG